MRASRRCSTRFTTCSSISTPPSNSSISRSCTPARARAPLQMLVANLDSSDYLGRIAIGRVVNGRVKIGDQVAVCKLDGRVEETKVTKLFSFEGLKRVDITEAAAGD